jgi:hypothetical protein
MEIPKLPPAAPAAPATGGRAGAAGPNGGAPAEPAAGGDRADIRALDVPAALLILATEILDAVGLPPPPSGAATPPQAAAVIVNSLLQALPVDSAGAHAWLDAEGALQSGIAAGLSRATAIVMARPPPDSGLVAALAQTHALIAMALSEDSPAGLPIGPEWSGLVQRLDAFRRRRRKLRRRWLDPDTEAPPHSS